MFIGLFGWRTRIMAGSLLIVSIILTSVLIAQIADNDSKRREKELYKNYVEQGFSDLADLGANFQSCQKEWITLVPPGQTHMLQSLGIKYFKPSGFPKDFISGLAPLQHDGYITYPVTVLEHPDTGEYVFLNAKGDKFYSEPASADYDHDWILHSLFPDIETQKSAEELALLKAQYDPARIVVTYELILQADLLVYISQLPQLNPTEPPIIIMKAYSGPAVTNIKFVSSERVGTGVLYTIAYPSSFTNDLDLMSCPSLLDYPFWDLEDTISVSSTNWVEWFAPGSGSTSMTKRFYVAANADITSATDPDDDGLAWGREKYMYHTCPTNSDTDGDGLDDYEEVITLDTDPNNDDTNKPAATFLFPTNNYRKVVIP